ncbi:MAG: hypothetical protein FJZ04_02295 [Candidatus Moranbacteria bacterium]|nr:hypothetical protein [Candidatus Moranbacteria bacterium]
MNILNISHAANNSIVGCSGSDCGLCSILETISRAYNFFMAVSFTVAVLIAITAGVSYLISGGNRSLFRKSSLFLKSAAGGFALILVGWLVIHTIILASGLQNQGGWWQFQCLSDTEKTAADKLNFAPYYQNLKKFFSLTDFLSSGEAEGKLEGPREAQILLTQLKALKEGETLQFLAPAQIQSMDGIENLFLPLLTVMKEGNNLKLESAGEYLDLLQNAWPKTSGQSNNQYANTLNRLLGTTSYTDNRYLLDASGNVLDGGAGGELSSLFDELGNILAGGNLIGERVGQTAATDSKNPDLSELLTGLLNNETNSNQGDKIISVILSETMKLANEVLVSRGVSISGKTEVSSTDWGYEQWRCLGNGGEWNNGKCQCPPGSDEEINAYCQPTKNLSQNCKKSGGIWRKIGEGINSTPACGLKKQSWDSPKYAASGESAGAESYYCQCKSGFCVDGEGACRADIDDDDGDKIANSQDVCPATASFEKNAVNRSTGGRYYGCGCSEIGIIPMECPPNQCVGDNWVIYPTGVQECQNGKLLAYSCRPESREFSEECLDKKLTSQGDGSGKDYTGKDYASHNGQNLNKNSFVSGNQSKPFNNSSSSNNSKQASKNWEERNSKKLDNSIGPRKDDFSKEPPRDGTPLGNGETGHNSPRGNGSPEAIKKALKRIHERDPLRYEMIFRFVKYIGPDAMGYSGICSGCGVIDINHYDPLKVMDTVIIHEATHSADACVNGWGPSSRAERVAVANQIGSMCRGEDHKDMREFPRQKEGFTYKGKEVRGYIARWVNISNQEGVNPKGDLGTAAFSWWVRYANIYGDRTVGPYHYGDHTSGIILGLKEDEEKGLRNIMESNRKCLSKPTLDLPPVEACKDAKEIQIR